MRKIGVCLLAGLCLVLIASSLPGEVFAQAEEDNGPIGDCLTASAGDREKFMSCLQENHEEIVETHEIPNRWLERIEDFIENHGDWDRRIILIMDRLEDRRDRREDKVDRQKDRRDRIEIFHDRGEDFRDQWEDRHDRAEDKRDRFENRRDRLEDWKDRREDRRDRRWPYIKI